MMKYETTCCVRCGKPARMWSGHILLGKHKVVAGWCLKGCLDVKGFVGHHHEWMPLRKVEA